MHGLSHFAQHGNAAFVRGKIVSRTKPVQKIIKETLGAADQLFESLAPERFDEAVWIVRRGHDRHTNRQTRSQQAVQRAHSGALARIIGIEAQNDFVSMALENAGMLRSESSALRRDNILHPRHEA